MKKSCKQREPPYLLKVNLLMLYEVLKLLRERKRINELRRLYRQRKWQTLRRLTGLSVLLMVVCQTVWAGPSLEPLGHDQYGVMMTVDEAIQKTLRSNALIKRAQERLKKEKALLKGKAAEFLPKFKSEIYSAAATGERHFLSYFDASIEQPVFEGGRTVALKNKQKTRVQIEEAKLLEDQDLLSLQVRILYAEVLREKELVRTAQAMVKELADSNNKIQTLFKQELIVNEELLKSEALLLKAKHALIEHKEKYDYLFWALKETLGISEGETIELEPFPEILEPENSVQPYLDWARNHGPIYKLKEAEVKEKSFEKKALQAERYPHLSFAARWNVHQDVFVDTNRTMMGILGKWNIWDFGRLGSEIEAKTHEIEESRLNGQIEIVEYEKRIRQSYHASRSLREKIRLAEADVREKEEAYKNAKTRLIAGEKPASEITESFVSLEEAKAGMVDAITEYRVVMASLRNHSSEESLDGSSS